MSKQIRSKPFPTQERLHGLLERHYDEDGTLYFISKVNRYSVKKGQKLYGYMATCNKGFPSEHERIYLGVDCYVQQIAVWNYIWTYGDYERDGNVVDHIDEDHSNNRHDNLRVISASDNIGRKRKSPKMSSPYHGVYFAQNMSKYTSSITIDGLKLYLGSYDTEIEAAQVYDKFASLKGEYAKYNFPRK